MLFTLFIFIILLHNAMPKVRDVFIAPPGIVSYSNDDDDDVVKC